MEYGKGSYGFNQDKSGTQIGGNWYAAWGGIRLPHNDTVYTLIDSLQSLKSKYNFLKIKLYEGTETPTASGGSYFVNCTLYDELDFYIGDQMPDPGTPEIPYVGPYPVITLDAYLTRPIWNSGGTAITGTGYAAITEDNGALKVEFSTNMPEGLNVIEIYAY